MKFGRVLFRFLSVLVRLPEGSARVEAEHPDVPAPVAKIG